MGKEFNFGKEKNGEKIEKMVMKKWEGIENKEKNGKELKIKKMEGKIIIS
jgi:hypothetical protein